MVRSASNTVVNTSTFRFSYVSLAQNCFLADSQLSRTVRTMRAIGLWPTLAPGVGFEPTRPVKGHRLTCGANSRPWPTSRVDCPVPGSGIPAQSNCWFWDYFPFWGPSSVVLFSRPVIGAFRAEKTSNRRKI